MLNNLQKIFLYNCIEKIPLTDNEKKCYKKISLTRNNI